GQHQTGRGQRRDGISFCCLRSGTRAGAMRLQGGHKGETHIRLGSPVVGLVVTLYDDRQLQSTAVPGDRAATARNVLRKLAPPNDYVTLSNRTARRRWCVG